MKLGKGTLAGQALIWSSYHGTFVWQPVIRRISYPLLHGVTSTQLPAATPLVIGSTYFDPETVFAPADATAAGLTRSITFKAIVESSTADEVSVQLLDVNGITSYGASGKITESLIEHPDAETATYYTADITSVFTNVRAAGILQCLLWSVDGALVTATCSMACIDVSWA